MATDNGSSPPTLPLEEEALQPLERYLTLLALKADPVQVLGEERISELQAAADAARKRARVSTDVLERMRWQYAAHEADRTAKGEVPEEEWEAAELAFRDSLVSASETLGVDAGYWRELGVPAAVLRSGGLAVSGKYKGSSRTSSPSAEERRKRIAEGERPGNRRRGGRPKAPEGTVLLSASVSPELRQAIYRNPAAASIPTKGEKAALLYAMDRQHEWEILRTHKDEELPTTPSATQSVISFRLPEEVWEECQKVSGGMTAGRSLRLLARYLL